MTWEIELSETADRQVRRMDKGIQRRVLDYLQQRVAPADDPHAFGKPLTGKYGGLWRYRVGDCALFAVSRNRASLYCALRTDERCINNVGKRHWME